MCLANMLKCRTCARLRPTKKMVDIFLPLNNDYPLQISEALLLCCSLNVMANDALPKQICKDCCVELWRAFTFRKKCQSSEMILKKSGLSGKESVSDVNYQFLTEFIPKELVRTSTEIPGNTNTKTELKLKQLKEENPLEIGSFEAVFLDTNSQTDDSHHSELFESQLNLDKETESKCLDTSSSLKHPKTVLHSASEKGIKRHRCVLCSDTFVHPDLLKEHEATHPSDELSKKKEHIKQCVYLRRAQKLFTCDICSKTCNQLSHMKEHMRIHSGEMPFECNKCGKQFIYGSSLHHHMTKLHGAVWHSCKLCGIFFDKRYKLSHHIKLVHDIDNGDDIIRKQQKLTERIRNEKSSYSWKTNRQKKSIVCELCGKVCNQTSHLKEHMRKHTKESPFVCHECGRTFMYGSSLYHHMKNLHGGIVHRCTICNKNFDKKITLTNHIKKMHTDKKTSTKTLELKQEITIVKEEIG